MSAETRRRWRAPLLLFAIVWLSCTWFGSWAFNPNNATRLFAALAIVERGTARIDEYAGMTIDRAEVDGHFLMDKAPGITLMAIPFVAATNALTGETSAEQPHVFYDRQMEAFLRLRMRIVIAFTVAVLTAFAATALLDLGTRMTGSRGAGLFAALSYGLGTIAWGWSTTIFGHAPVAALFVIAIWATWRATGGGPPGRFAALAGLALGWAVVVEHPAAMTGAPIALWALWRVRRWERPARWRTIGIAAAAGLAALIPLFAYNILAFGHPLAVGYSNVVGFDGMKQGFFGLTYPKPEILYEITLGQRRGLIWVAPVLALAPYGLWILLRDRARRDLGVMLVAGALAALLYNAAYVYWEGGYATGPRHAVPAIAYLAVALAAFWQDANRVEKWLGGVFLTASIAINLTIAAAEILAPDFLKAPLTEQIIPQFLIGNIRTVPSEFWGWSTASGLWLYLAIAAMLAGGLAWAIRDESEDR
ncbi:hypothetical protein [Sphingomonas sp.]|uniref:hypothetical protein n=1 Tax=Sphingomonas sp. TaxID=28214 RepID=UPI001ECA6DA8|nr:hypothetical protein [Sphingomonas sp.]MBX3594989.1 hypothetical protein [Sphingomonas sp.]